MAAKRPQEAAAEFGKIADQRGLALNYPVGAIAQLQHAEALPESSDHDDAALYAHLREQWKDADPDMPRLKSVRAFAGRVR